MRFRHAHTVKQNGCLSTKWLPQLQSSEDQNIYYSHFAFDFIWVATRKTQWYIVATIEALYALLSSFEALCGLLSNQFSSTIPIVKLCRCFLVTNSPVFNSQMSNLEECMTLWGEPEWVHLIVEQLHANGCHQNVTERSTILGLRISHKRTHVHHTWLCESGLATMFLRLLARSKIKCKSAKYHVHFNPASCHVTS